MIKNYLELGQIVSTHGIKGEVRFNPWCDTPDFVKKFKTFHSFFKRAKFRLKKGQNFGTIYLKLLKK